MKLRRSGTNQPIYGAASISIKNTIYIYGGFYHVSPWNKEALWTLNATGNLVQLPTDPYASPALIYTSIQNYQDKHLFVFGGHLNEAAIHKSEASEYLRYYRLDLATLKWKPLQKKNTTVNASPLERFWHTTSMYKDKVYMLGGMNKSHGMNDFWMYDMTIDTWTRLPMFSKTGICGHTSIMTDDGKMITLGGFQCPDTKDFSLLHDKNLVPLNKAFVFDTSSHAWYEKNLTGSAIPSPRTFHTAVKTKNQKIVICGGMSYRMNKSSLKVICRANSSRLGQDKKASPFQTYLSPSMALLDVETWSWNIASASPYQPLPRSHAVTGIIDDTKVVYGLGINDHTVYDDFYLFDLESNQWISTQLDAPAKSETKLEDWKIGLCVVGGVFVLMFTLFFIYRSTRKNSQHFQMVYISLKKTVWNPRSGEPLWAESSRLAFRVLSLVIFSAVAAALVIQVEKSPVIEQQHEEYISNREVVLPDVRLCFDGWFKDQSPTVQCTSNTGESCTQYMINMTDAVQSSLNYYGMSRPSCVLFQASLSSSNSTPSYVNFYYTGQPANTSAIHVELYHPHHNPNVPIYNLKGDFDSWYTPDEKSRFQTIEQMNLRTENTYTIPSNTDFTKIGYSFHERHVLPTNDLRSLIGLFGRPSYQRQFSIRSRIFNDQLINETPVNVGVIQLFSSSSSVMIIEEQRTFTLIQGLGVLGGFVGLFVALLVNLFGFRPRSPFGIVHRWFLPKTQAALLKGLKENILPSTNKQQYNDKPGSSETPLYVVPIVQPVHERFLKTPVYHSKINDKKDSCIAATDIEADNQQQMTRMTRLENRLRIFDVLLKAYYFDDEVFESLRNQRQH
ncbi:hypothetical protein BD560DRAFT_485978 [Blakeslea trispora]|nr:hypothetical protein BD560DRAFT_485978 [Blakeslea trispora]